MSGPSIVYSIPPGITLRDFATLNPKERPGVAAKIAKLERKVFPSSEGFDYDVELKKKNIGVSLAFKEHDKDLDQVVAYLVYQRMKRVVWLHKLCVIEQERRKGLGKCLIQALCYQMAKGGGGSLQLWVDEHREPARTLYDTYGFKQIEVRPDYYAPGRAGIKMELAIGT
jgi:ribosomal protein S18 acetylase RimI-like enzyme